LRWKLLKLFFLAFYLFFHTCNKDAKITLTNCFCGRKMSAWVFKENLRNKDRLTFNRPWYIPCWPSFLIFTSGAAKFHSKKNMNFACPRSNKIIRNIFEMSAVRLIIDTDSNFTFINCSRKSHFSKILIFKNLTELTYQELSSRRWETNYSCITLKYCWKTCEITSNDGTRKHFLSEYLNRLLMINASIVTSPYFKVAIKISLLSQLFSPKLKLF
jgi:hypothetical protein